MKGDSLICNCFCHKAEKSNNPKIRFSIPIHHSGMCCDKCPECGKNIKWNPDGYNMTIHRLFFCNLPDFAPRYKWYIPRARIDVEEVLRKEKRFDLLNYAISIDYKKKELKK